MMRVADLVVAQTIVDGLIKVAGERAAIAGGLESAGVRCAGSSAMWIHAAKEDHPAIERIMLARLAAKEAHFRRRAAQIGLSLETSK